MGWQTLELLTVACTGQFGSTTGCWSVNESQCSVYAEVDNDELANFLLLIWLLGRKQFDGQVAGTYLFIYGFGRYFLEFLRNDPGRGSVFHGVMSGTQLLAIIMVVSGGLLLWARRPAT